MAKELPYFQFEPAEYLTKDISFCSLSAQGLFINICAFYWQRECNLTKAQVLRRFNYPDVLKELIDECIIKFDENENIVISFLLNQYNEIIGKKSNDSEKGKIGNLKRWHKDIYEKFKKQELSLNEALEIAKKSGGDTLAIAKTSHIREDNIREEEIKEDDIIETKNDFFKKELLSSSLWIEQLAMNNAKKFNVEEIKEKLNEFTIQLNLKFDFKINKKDFTQHFVSWLNIQEKPQKQTIKFNSPIL